ncbi:DUF4054 domain-containing protein [Providencia rettgeri]
MGAVEITVNEFRADYSEFANVSNEEVLKLIREATLLLENSDFSVVADLDKRKRLLYLLVAHLCYLSVGDNRGNGGSGFVGRVSSASEGSVSVATSLGELPASATWYVQSSYGFLFWEATKIYRMGVWFSGADYH